jgi:hypothetical protein
MPALVYVQLHCHAVCVFLSTLHFINPGMGISCRLVSAMNKVGCHIYSDQDHIFMQAKLVHVFGCDCPRVGYLFGVDSCYYHQFFQDTILYMMIDWASGHHITKEQPAQSFTLPDHILWTWYKPTEQTHTYSSICVTYIYLRTHIHM